MTLAQHLTVHVQVSHPTSKDDILKALDSALSLLEKALQAQPERYLQARISISVEDEPLPD